MRLTAEDFEGVHVKPSGKPSELLISTDGPDNVHALLQGAGIPIRATNEGYLVGSGYLRDLQKAFAEIDLDISDAVKQARKSRRSHSPHDRVPLSSKAGTRSR